MFEPFSNSYYIGRMFVTPADADRPVIQQAQLQRLNDECVGTDEPIADLDRPLVMKLGRRHFPVHGDAAVPAGTLAMPDEDLEETAVDNPPTIAGVLLATGARARQLLWLTGQLPTVEGGT
ncbi:MAG: DUF5802 family protein [Halobacteriales archaeon]